MNEMNYTAKKLYDFCEYLNTDFTDKERNSLIARISFDTEEPAETASEIYYLLFFYELAQLQPKHERLAFFHGLVENWHSGNFKMIVVNKKNKRILKGDF